MSFLGAAGLAALLFSSQNSPQNNCSIPIQERTERYAITVGVDVGLFQITGDEDGGEVAWHYAITPTEIKSDFRISTRNRALSELLNATNTSIASAMVCTAEGKSKVSHYDYKEFKRQEKGDLLPTYRTDFTLENNGTVSASCYRRSEKGIFPITCLYGTPSLSAPDLFTLLLQVSYALHLEEMIQQSSSRKALYAGREAEISLQKISEESVHNRATVKYKLLGMNMLLGREVSFHIWLDKDFPHVLERAELAASLGVVRVEKR